MYIRASNLQSHNIVSPVIKDFNEEKVHREEGGRKERKKEGGRERESKSRRDRQVNKYKYKAFKGAAKEGETMIVSST